MAICMAVFALGLLAGDERSRKQLFLLHHVTKGGCLDEFDNATNKCRHASTDGADVEACIKATGALRNCFAKKPNWFGAYFTGRMDKGLDQDTKPRPKQIKEEKREEPYGYRWWTGMRRN